MDNRLFCLTFALVTSKSASQILTVTPPCIKANETVTLKCDTTDFSSSVFFYLEVVNNQGGCFFGSCTTSIIGYEQPTQSGTYTQMTITAYNDSRDGGVWACSFGGTRSNNYTAELQNCGHASTLKPTSQPLPDQKCFLGIHYQLSVCVIIMIVGIIFVLIIVASIIYWCISCRKDSNKSSKPEQKHICNDSRNGPEKSENEGDEGISPKNGSESNLKSNDEFTPEQNHTHVDSNSRNVPEESENRENEGISLQNGSESNLKSNDEFTPEQNHVHVDSNSSNVPEESENRGDEGISLQNGRESNLKSNNKTTNSPHQSESSFDYQSQNNPDKSACNENSDRVEDDTSKFDAAKDAVTQV